MLNFFKAIKNLFSPSVAKRLPELSKLSKSDEINLIVDRFNSLKEITDKYPSKTFKMFNNKEEGWCLSINLDYLKGH